MRLGFRFDRLLFFVGVACGWKKAACVSRALYFSAAVMGAFFFLGCGGLVSRLARVVGASSFHTILTAAVSVAVPVPFIAVHIACHRFLLEAMSTSSWNVAVGGASASMFVVSLF